MAFEGSSSYFVLMRAIYFTMVAMNVFLLCPCTVYYCQKLRKLRDEQFFHHRYPLLSIYFVITFVFLFVIARAIADIQNLYPTLIEQQYRYYWYPYFSLLPVVLCIIRCWFLFYDYSHGLQSISMEWKTKLIQDIDVSSSHWTFEYQWLSCRSNIIYYIGIGYVILSELLNLITMLFNPSAAQYVYAMSVFILVIVLVTLAYKIRSYRDELYIKTEFKLLGYPTIIYISCYLIVVTFTKDELRAVCLYPVLTIAAITYIYVTTVWIIKKYDDREQMKNMSLLNISDDDDKSHKTLNQCLQNEDVFDLFAIYLVKELSIENLLFLFEFMKFKNECIKNTLLDIDDIDDIGHILDFGTKSNELQRSNSIVNDIESFQYNIIYIYNRYIDVNGEFCVNISSLTRKKIKLAVLPYINSKIKQNNIDGDKILELMTLFNKAMGEIIQMMTLDSFMRFKETKQFKQFNKK